MALANDPVAHRTSALRNRSMRRPKHNFYVKGAPFQLIPTALAPVLAGDTLKSANLQFRGVTKALAEGLLGWHLDHFLFFVRIMDMADGETILATLIDENAGYLTHETESTVRYSSGVDWLNKAKLPIARHYFRDYGESPTNYQTNGMPQVQTREASWFEHFIDQASLPADDGGLEDFENLWSKWQVLSRNRLTTQTYEEFLRAQGVEPPPNLREPDSDLQIPELVRHFKQWDYPNQVAQPDAGGNTEADTVNVMSWAGSDRADRSRRFNEPGFLVGLAVARCKTYLPIATDTQATIAQHGSVAGYMDSAKAWMPYVYNDEPGESIRTQNAGSGPLTFDASLTTPYAWDMRDLWLQGDQMVINPTNPQMFARRGMTTSAEQSVKYLRNEAIDALFADSATDSRLDGVTLEGVWQFNLASRVRAMSK